MLYCLIKNFIWETSKGKTQIKKRVQCIICPNIIHKKNPYGENGWYDIILCQYCLIKNFLWETLKGKKTHTKKRVQYDVFNKLLIREMRDSPLKLANLLYRYTQHIRNVEYGRLCEYLFEIITILSSPMFICPYDLWNRTILMQNIAISITCLSKQHKMHYLYR